MAAKTGKKTRTVYSYEFGPSRLDNGPETEPVRLFELLITIEDQEQDGRRAGGWVAASRETVKATPQPLTRRQVQAIIESGADWLAYLGEGSE